MNRLTLAVLMWAGAAVAAPATKVTFESRQSWTSARWYLLGELRQGEIFWLSGARSRMPLDARRCRPTSLGSLEEAGLKNADSEVLSRGNWIAVEVDPALKGDELELEFSKGCKTKVAIAWSPDGGGAGGGLAPYLFLKPAGNVYMGYEFTVKAPKLSRSTDIQLDIMGGAWKMNLGNAEAGANKSLILTPVVEARGEWVPSSLGGLGFELHMLQGLGSFGGIAQQDLLVSEWSGGAFYQTVFRVGQGMVWRVHADFFQRVVDQGTEVESLGAFETDHRGLHFGVSMSQYFARRWHVQLRGDYGYPARTAGLGLDQSFLKVRGHVGFLLTESMTWLLEGAYRSYGYSGQQSSTSIAGATGIRLEL